MSKSEEPIQRSGSGRWMWLVGGVLVGLLFVSPVSAHISDSVAHLWSHHIKPRADKRYPHSIVRVESGTVTISAGNTDEAIADCPADKITLGGGASSVGFDEVMQVVASHPLFDDSGWRVVGRNPGTGDGSIVAYAICAKVG